MPLAAAERGGGSDFARRASRLDNAGTRHRAGRVGPEFERTSGVHLRIVSGLPAAFERQAAAGEPFDLLISGSATVDRCVRAGRVVGATRKELARSGIGVAVRAGAQKPDVRSLDAFRRALLDAKSIAYLRVGSGLYLDSLFERLDLARVVKAKATRPEGDSVALKVANGAVELLQGSTATRVILAQGMERPPF